MEEGAVKITGFGAKHAFKPKVEVLLSQIPFMKVTGTARKVNEVVPMDSLDQGGWVVVVEIKEEVK